MIVIEGPPSDNELHYVSGQGRNDFPELLQTFEAMSAVAASRQDAVLDHPYGPHQRQRLDWFPSIEPARATLIYYHAGYWQSRDKSTFRFIADSFNAAGLNVAVVNYPLCPDVSIPQLVDAVAASLRAARALAPTPIILSGHSAGAHIAVELAMRFAPDIRGLVAISGVYDLQPLIETSLNRALRLDRPMAIQTSPVLRVRGRCSPAIFAVGGDETAAFVTQNRAMASAWSAAGNEARSIEARGAHHFSVLQYFVAPENPLHRATLDLI